MFHLLTREITLLQSWDWRERGEGKKGRREGMKESFYDGYCGGDGKGDPKKCGEEESAIRKQKITKNTFEIMSKLQF